jgi:hypothetical protein
MANGLCFIRVPRWRRIEQFEKRSTGLQTRQSAAKATHYIIIVSPLLKKDIEWQNIFGQIKLKIVLIKSLRLK